MNLHSNWHALWCISLPSFLNSHAMVPFSGHGSGLEQWFLAPI